MFKTLFTWNRSLTGKQLSIRIICLIFVLFIHFIILNSAMTDYHRSIDRCVQNKEKTIPYDYKDAEMGDFWKRHYKFTFECIPSVNTTPTRIAMRSGIFIYIFAFYYIIALSTQLKRKKVKLKNKIGMLTEHPIGFSWKLFFFSFFYTLLRGDFKWTSVILCTYVVEYSILWYLIHSDVAKIFILLYWLLPLCTAISFSCIYNSIHIRHLLDNGWVPLNKNEQISLNKIGIKFVS